MADSCHPAYICEQSSTAQPQSRYSRCVGVPDPEPQSRYSRYSGVPDPEPQSRYSRYVGVPDPEPQSRYSRHSGVPDLQLAVVGARVQFQAHQTHAADAALVTRVDPLLLGRLGVIGPRLAV